MKKIILFFLIIYSTTSLSQKVEIANIFSQEFNYNSQEFYMDDKENIVFFLKYFSSEQLNTEHISIEDIIVGNSLKENIGKYTYYVKLVHEKDNFKGRYILKEQRLIDKMETNNLNKIIFKCLTDDLKSYECDDNLYLNVLLLKTFVDTAAILTLSEDKKKVKLQLIKEDCSIANSEDYFKKDIQYYKNENLLILKNKNSFILVFDGF